MLLTAGKLGSVYECKVGGIHVNDVRGIASSYDLSVCTADRVVVSDAVVNTSLFLTNNELVTGDSDSLAVLGSDKGCAACCSTAAENSGLACALVKYGCVTCTVVYRRNKGRSCGCNGSLGSAYAYRSRSRCGTSCGCGCGSCLLLAACCNDDDDNNYYCYDKNSNNCDNDKKCVILLGLGKLSDLTNLFVTAFATGLLLFACCIGGSLLAYSPIAEAVVCGIRLGLAALCTCVGRNTVFNNCFTLLVVTYVGGIRRITCLYVRNTKLIKNISYAVDLDGIRISYFTVADCLYDTDNSTVFKNCRATGAAGAYACTMHKEVCTVYLNFLSNSTVGNGYVLCLEKIGRVADCPCGEAETVDIAVDLDHIVGTERKNGNVLYRFAKLKNSKVVRLTLSAAERSGNSNVSVDNDLILQIAVIIGSKAFAEYFGEVCYVVCIEIYAVITCKNIGLIDKEACFALKYVILLVFLMGVQKVNNYCCFSCILNVGSNITFSVCKCRNNE